MMRALLTAMLTCFPFTVMADETIKLYPEGLPGAADEEPKTLPSNDGVVRMTNFSAPFMKVIRPQQSNGWGVIICPGGGYTILSVNKEGDDIGALLAKKGYTAYVLRSRITDGNETYGRYPAPLEDARKALDLAREDGAQHGVKADQIGVLGFSAGGHLAGLLATDAPKFGRTEAGPAFGALIYPVVTMISPWTHGGSRNRLLGPNPPEELMKTASLELRLDKAHTAPLFVVHGQFDGAVPVKNSLVLAEEATQRKIPVSLHVYPLADHGFGAGRPGKTDPAYAWPDLFDVWVQALRK